MIESTDFDFPKSKVDSKWLGNDPATFKDINEAEKKLKVALPSDYKDFVLISNGFHAFNDVEPTFHSLDKIDYLYNIDPELIKIWIYTGNSDIAKILDRSIVIAGIQEEQMFLIIPPDTGMKNWRYWKFAAWIPGEEPYNDLMQYFKRVLDFMTQFIKQ
jgi:cell wall assembly regulator SMI1